MQDLTKLTIAETADLLSNGKATSLDVTNAYLDRIDKLNPHLNAYLSVFHDEARIQAKASDARREIGIPLSKLDGVPIALKDNISTFGQPTTAASQILKDYKPQYDATVVKKIKAAGLIILGKTNLDEFAMGGSTENSGFGMSKNPWDTSRVPGGSSGGSAVAVAADLCAGALGSDTGGSIRQPAGLCGIVGMKPTYGTVSRYGLLAMASSLDQIGPMTKSVEDAGLLLNVIMGHDQFDGTSLLDDIKTAIDLKSDIQGLKIGVPEEYFTGGMDPDVEKTVRAAIVQLESQGAEIVNVSLPTSPMSLAVYYVIVPVEVASNMARYDGIRFGQSVERENGSHSLSEVYKQTRQQFIGPEVKRRIMLGTYASSAGYYDAYYNKAMKVRALIKQEFDEVLKTVDVIATPVSPNPAFKVGEKVDDPLAMYLEDMYTVPLNIAGLPGISVPCGFVEKEGSQLPVGLQLIGRRLDEQTVLNVARAYEASTDWHKQRPNM